MSQRGILPAGSPGQLGVELGVVPPPPIICLFFWLLLLGCPASDPGQQSLCPCPLSCFPPETFSSKLVQGRGSGGRRVRLEADSPERPQPPRRSCHLHLLPASDVLLGLAREAPGARKWVSPSVGLCSLILTIGCLFRSRKPA